MSTFKSDIAEKESVGVHNENQGLEKPGIDSADNDPDYATANVDFSHIDEKKVLRKMDLRLIPMLALLYLLSFLDRGNIGML
jgi:hypothetical protein